MPSLICLDAREQGKQQGRKPRVIYIINTTSLHSVVFLYNCIENIEENVVDNYITCTCVALTQTYTGHAHTNRQIIDIEQG